MTDFIKQLRESGLLDEESKSSISEAWDKKVQEVREEESAHLREEFAKRYEHDKSVMVEAADKMFNDLLTKELKEFREERKQLVEARVRYTKMIDEHSKAITNYVGNKLRNEIVELREDRSQLHAGLVKFEEFAIKKLTTELNEFHEDKNALIEKKVELARTAETKLNEAKKNFVQRAAVIIESNVHSALEKELTQLHKDIEEARRNNFGRRIFEAFAAEFMTSRLSDGTQAKKLLNTVKAREGKLKEAMTLVKKQNTLLEQSDSKARLAEDRFTRHQKLNDLLSPLSGEKKALMENLLENVRTGRLDAAYKKHIKYVLVEDSNSNSGKNQKPLTESRREFTGGRRAPEVSQTIDDEIQQIKKLAGI